MVRPVNFLDSAIKFGFVAFSILIFSGVAQAQVDEYPGDPSDGIHVPDEILVKYKSAADTTRISRLERRLRASWRSSGRRGKVRRLRIRQGSSVAQALAEFRADPTVDFAEPNFIATADFVPNDSYYDLQWNMGRIHAETAWDVTAGASTVVAVLDTGVAYEDRTAGSTEYCLAPDLAGTCFVAGWDFINNDSHPNDDNSHGTHVAGTVAGYTHNALGVAGLAFESCVMPVKVLDAEGSGSYSTIADGIIWAADNGAHVINMSLSGPSTSATLANALEYAYNKGVTIVASTGNDDSNVARYPAGYDDWVIAVGATRFDNALANYSNYGPVADLVAPGGDVDVDQNGDGYGDGILQNTLNPNTGAVCDFSYWFFQGTSMAAPHVAALSAMVIATGNATTPDEVRCVLEATATDLGTPGRDDRFGWGLIDAEKAVTSTCGVGEPPPNQNPAAGFTVSPTGLAANFTDTSTDSDGTIASWSWDFGDGGTSDAQSPSHTFGAGGTYAVVLTVTDDDGATNSASQDVTVSDPSAGPIEVFSDSFQNGAWDGKWSEDSQNDWFTSTQRATSGNSSAEVDGGAADAQLISVPIDMQGRTQATITFNWYIERGLDSGEYLAFDVSTDGGSNWTERAKLSGNLDDENTWHQVQVDLNGISSLRLRFRGQMSAGREDANVDEVRVTAAASSGEVSPTNEEPIAGFTASSSDLIATFTDTSTDNDGTIASWSWDFGDGATSDVQSPSHTYGSGGTYSVGLTVTDDDGATNAVSQNVTVSGSSVGPIEVFSDSFQNGAWDGKWAEDSQDDWFTSTQRATSGNGSAEVDGRATDAQLISVPIDMQGHTQANITFNWYIERGLDRGEYLAFDVSTDGGSSWTEYARLSGNVDTENTWHQVEVVPTLNGASSLQLRFRGRMSGGGEDANVDDVMVMAR